MNLLLSPMRFGGITKAVNLSKADFDKSNCRNCLHNSSVANTHLKNHEIELKPHHCLFALCAQHDALDEELLSQRTVVDECDSIHPASESVSVIDEKDLFNNAQMDLGVPDTDDGSFCQAPLSKEAGQTEAFEPQTVSITGADNSAPIDAHHSESAKPEAKAESYLDVVRNAWWRDALKHRVIEQGTPKETLNFVVACLATNSVKDVLSGSPEMLFNELCSSDGDNTVASLAAMFVDELTLENVRHFLKSLNVDLTLTGCISKKVLCELTQGELSLIADHFSLPETDELCDAYADGVESFANAIAEAVGMDSLADYIPPSLRP
ncbi:hypothetical protein KXJ72_17860 (plasmid) [Comamonas aquatica]|nr:hypothetical protein KXJ72_17860 [Comamonas aquatica]